MPTAEESAPWWRGRRREIVAAELSRRTVEQPNLTTTSQPPTTTTPVQGAAITMDDIEKMSADQINKLWAEKKIQPILEQIHN